MRGWARRLWRWDVGLFAVCLLAYLITRLDGLTRFPIYFFCDEAVQSTLADALVHHGLRSADGVFLPPYFKNDTRFNLSLSVYLQVPGVLLFGTSVWATRATTVVVGLLGVAALAVTMRIAFKARAWWITPLVLGAIPAWFLHSRTGFEVAIMVPMYACFLGAYALYRLRSPRWIVAAIVFGAATFYSYANGQGLMAVTGVGLVLSDLGHHRRVLRERRVWLPAAITAVVSVAPYVRERLLHPATTSEHLRSLDSYWYRHGSVPSKLATFAREYATGLDPRYWFSTSNTSDLSRHVMRGMGHVWWPLAPFVLLGLLVCLRRWRSSMHRMVLIAVVASPFSAALVQIQITRVLAMVVPITLLCCIGIEHLLVWIRDRRLRACGAGLLAFALASLSIGTLQTALADGPLWYRDYGLGGMQWGASEVMGAVEQRLQQDPGLHVVISPTWSNNTNVFGDFFLDPAERNRVRFTGVGTFLDTRSDLDPDWLFVLPPDEYQQAITSNKLVVSPPERIIAWPDGRPGFFFARMRYVDGVDALFAADAAAASRLVVDTTTLGGGSVTVAHSALDIGRVADLFDGDTATLIRGRTANPFVLDVSFSEPRQITGFTLTTATMDYDLDVAVTDSDGRQIVLPTQRYRGLPADPTVRVTLPAGVTSVQSIHLSLSELHAGPEAHIHVRELSLLPG